MSEVPPVESKTSTPAPPQTSVPTPSGDLVPHLSKFVRDHLAIINNTALAAATIAGLLDFFGPKLGILPTVVYSGTGVILGLLIVIAAVPAAFGRLLSALGSEPKSPPQSVRIYTRPTYQVLVAMFAAVTIIGFVSAAKASEGGVIAAAFPDARKLQIRLLNIEADVAEIKVGVRDANGKLDVLVSDSKDPQMELTKRGYAFYGSGLSKAIQQGDKRAVALFVKAGLRVNDESVLNVLLRKDVPWNDDMAGMLSRSMFVGREDCKAGYVFTGGWTNDHIPERVALYKRLCNGDEMVARLKQAVADDKKAGPAPNEVWADYRKYRKIYLDEFLKG